MDLLPFLDAWQPRGTDDIDSIHLLLGKQNLKGDHNGKVRKAMYYRMWVWN